MLPPATTGDPPPAGEPPGEDAARVQRRMERTVFDLVNVERRQRGLPDVEWDDQLADLAREWSRRMADRGRLEHQDAERMLERTDASSAGQADPDREIPPAEPIVAEAGEGPSCPGGTGDG